MSPFAGDRVRTGKQLSIHDDSTADASAEDHAEHHSRAPPRPVHRLRQREAVGVVFQTDLSLQGLLQVLLETLADQPGRVGVLDQPGHPGQRAWHADPDTAPLARLLLY